VGLRGGLGEKSRFGGQDDNFIHPRHEEAV
jgi:hypothetical protein